MKPFNQITRSLCTVAGLLCAALLIGCGHEGDPPPVPIGGEASELVVADTGAFVPVDDEAPDVTRSDEQTPWPWGGVTVEQIQAGAGPCADCLTLGARLGLSDVQMLRSGSSFSVMAVSPRLGAIEPALHEAALIWRGDDVIELSVKVESSDGTERMSKAPGARWSLSFVSIDDDLPSSHELTLRLRVGPRPTTGNAPAGR